VVESKESVVKYTEADFHLPRPKPPTRDFRWYSLILPPIGFSIGMVLFGLLGFSFVELRDMPAMLRSNIVVMGSIGLAIGSELGTLPALLEVFRKVGARKAGVWDWIGLTVSVFTSITILIMSWAWLLQIDVMWSETIRVYGPLLLGSLTILDFTASGVEAGLYLATYDERFTRWQTDLEDWLIQMNGQREPKPAASVNYPATEFEQPMGMIEHSISLEPVEGVTTSTPGPPVWADLDGGLYDLLNVPPEGLSNESCWCGWRQADGNETHEQHADIHRWEARNHESASAALTYLRAEYMDRRTFTQGYGIPVPDWPTILDIVKWREEK